MVSHIPQIGDAGEAPRDATDTFSHDDVLWKAWLDTRNYCYFVYDFFFEIIRTDLTE
jgi:hypothetical protein